MYETQGREAEAEDVVAASRHELFFPNVFPFIFARLFDRIAEVFRSPWGKNGLTF